MFSLNSDRTKSSFAWGTHFLCSDRFFFRWNIYYFCYFLRNCQDSASWNMCFASVFKRFDLECECWVSDFVLKIMWPWALVRKIIWRHALWNQVTYFLLNFTLDVNHLIHACARKKIGWIISHAFVHCFIYHY